MKSRRQTLESRFDRLARILADRYDIEVVHRGRECHTDGRKITLPVFPEFSTIPEDELEDLIRLTDGHLDHEVGHICESDWRALDYAKDKVTNSYVQMVEDCRIEECQRKRWRGAGSNLDFSRRYVVRKEIFPNWDETPEAQKIWDVAYLMGMGDDDLLSEVPEQELVERLEPLRPVLHMAKDLPSSMHSLALGKWIVDALGLQSKVESSQELQEAMEEILKQIEEALEGAQEEGGSEAAQEESSQEEPEESTGSSEGQEEAQEGQEGQEEPSQEGEGEGSGEGEGTTSSESEGGGLSEALQKKMSEVGESANVGEVPKPMSMCATISKEAQALQAQVVETNQYYLPYTNTKDRATVAESGDPAWFQAERGAARKDTGVLTRRLRMSLASVSRTEISRGMTSGELDPSALHGLIISGDDRVFTQRTQRMATNARMCMVVDCSGSMRIDSRIEHARRASETFGEFAESMGIPFEILGFSSADFDTGHKRWTGATYEQQTTYTRWGDLELLIYKSYTEHWRRVGHRLQTMDSRCYTYDGDAVLVAAKRMLLTYQPGERLIMLVLSDGLPEEGIGANNENMKWWTGEVARRVQDAGIELIGIGIQTKAVKKYYDNFVVLEDPEEIAGAEIKKLRELLLGGSKSKSGRRRRAM